MAKFKPYDYEQMVMIPIGLKEQLDPPPCDSIVCPPTDEWAQPSPKPDAGPAG